MEWQGSKVERDVWLAHKILLKVDFLHLTWYILQNRWGSLKSFFAQNYYAAELLSLAKLRHRALQKVGFALSTGVSDWNHVDREARLSNMSNTVFRNMQSGYFGRIFMNLKFALNSNWENCFVTPVFWTLIMAWCKDNHCKYLKSRKYHHKGKYLCKYHQKCKYLLCNFTEIYNFQSKSGNIVPIWLLLGENIWIYGNYLYENYPLYIVYM